MGDSTVHHIAQQSEQQQVTPALDPGTGTSMDATPTPEPEKEAEAGQGDESVATEATLDAAGAEATPDSEAETGTVAAVSLPPLVSALELAAAEAAAVNGQVHSAPL